MKKTDSIIAILFALAVLGAYSIYKPFLLSMVVALLLTMATANMHKKKPRYMIIGAFLSSSMHYAAMILIILLGT